MAEPWIRVHANLAYKRITLRAMEALHIDRVKAVGHLTMLWGQLSQQGDNGQLAGLSDLEIEDWAGWRGKRGAFAAFIREKCVDQDGRAKEWDEYNGALEARRAADRERQRQHRERKEREAREREERDAADRDARDNSDGRHADVTRDNRVTSAPTRANETRRDETKRDDFDLDPSVDGVVISDPALTALYLTICANRAITERWGEQVNPLTRGSHAVELADALSEAGVEPNVARLSIYEQCRNSKNDRPPTTVNYFKRGILEAWEQEQARRDLSASGESPPPRAAARQHGNGRMSPGEQQLANILGPRRGGASR